jgi:hypothetical protein
VRERHHTGVTDQRRQLGTHRFALEDVQPGGVDDPVAQRPEERVLVDDATP